MYAANFETLLHLEFVKHNVLKGINVCYMYEYKRAGHVKFKVENLNISMNYTLINFFIKKLNL